MRNANWLGKTGQKIPSLISCYSAFHMEQLREWKTEDIYMFWPTGNAPRACIIFRNVALCANQETTCCWLTQQHNQREEGQHSAWETCENTTVGNPCITPTLNKLVAHLSQAYHWHCTLMESLLPLKISSGLHPPVLLKIAFPRKEFKLKDLWRNRKKFPFFTLHAVGNW